jgi:cellulose synthase/poly-beta-1,6-N-acetylglucosamine synthase-like glycosyltransferase
MLVRKDIYMQSGGLDEQLRVGEDVDFCWKLMAGGYRLMYVPKGQIKHKHRNRLYENFRRRFDYGTSEAVLYNRYRHVIKRFPWFGEGIVLLLLCLAGLTLQSLPLLLSVPGLLLLASIYQKEAFKRRFDVRLPWITFLSATARRHVMLAHQIGYHLARYYLVAALVAAIFIPRLAMPLIALAILPAVVVFQKKKPALGFPVFLLFFGLEQVFYQTGVIWGCLKQRSFRLYRILPVPVGGRQMARLG